VKKTAITFALIIFSMALFSSFTLNASNAYAQTTNYNIQTVNHNVQILYSGHTIIQDTIQITGQTPDKFQIGFPYKYGAYILKAIAYDSNNKTLPTTLGVQLQNKNGYYGASITMSPSSTQTFTVVFTFSNGLLTSTQNGFTLDFPAYPSFTTTTTQCNTTLTLPSEADNVGIDKTDGAINGTSYSATNLAAFTSTSATATFTLPSGVIQLVDIPTLTRHINIDPAGAITSADNYKIVNNSTANINSFIINLPTDASNVNARDEFGRILSITVEQRPSQTQLVNATLIFPITSGKNSQLTLDYSLPSVTPQQSGKFTLNLDLFPYFNYYVDSATVTINPPEGAKISTPQLSAIGPSLDLTRNVFQETLTVNREGISFIDSTIPSQESLQVAYDYSPLWIAFRPTSWVWAAAVVGCIIAALWTRPRAKAPSRIVVPKMAVGLSPEHIKSFIDSYNERHRITSEIKSLEARAQRGRMPRRKYKVQRRTLELRLNTLTHNINNLKEMLRGAGGNYGDLVRQLEVAEVELQEVELSLSTVETRHEIGEIPIAAYRKQLGELEQRKRKAEAAVNGLLLRIRQEIR